MKIVKITDSMREGYMKLYTEHYSVSEVMRLCNDGVGRKRIVDVLVDAGIYEGLNGENYLKHKVTKHIDLMQSKYGVSNWGELKTSGWTVQNKIDYRKISFIDEEYKIYRKKVETLTKKNVKKTKQLPSYCEYTGIMFADVEYIPNPNDPRKRTIDHKKPIISCYLDGDSPEFAADFNNLIFVLRYVNSVKSNTEHNSFIPIAEKIRKIFLNENYKHKKM